MVCTSVSEKNFDDCLKLVSVQDFAEIRLDLVCFSDEQVRELFKAHPRLIATYRPGKVEDNERLKQLKIAVESGAAFIDIEVESKHSFCRELIGFASKHNCEVIISYHNFDLTPTPTELYKVLDKCFEMGADLAKIACYVNNDHDNARLLSLCGLGKRVVVVGMGARGKITRITGPYVGSEFTFVAVDEQHITAPGQISRDEIKELYKHINKILKDE